MLLPERCGAFGMMMRMPRTGVINTGRVLIKADSNAPTLSVLFNVGVAKTSMGVA
jgi:hypothetical protein